MRRLVQNGKPYRTGWGWFEGNGHGIPTVMYCLYVGFNIRRATTPRTAARIEEWRHLITPRFLCKSGDHVVMGSGPTCWSPPSLSRSPSLPTINDTIITDPQDSNYYYYWGSGFKYSSSDWFKNMHHRWGTIFFRFLFIYFIYKG